MAFDLQGYVTVNERLKHALAKWPELRVQESEPVLVQAGDQLFVQVTTTVWRTPDDPLPAIASCWEQYPGTSSFTRGSEQQNASTSSLGRCLGLMGVHIEAGIASKDEVALAKHRAARADHPSNQPADDKPKTGGAALRSVGGGQPASEAQLRYLAKLAKERGVTIEPDELERLKADKRQCSARIEELSQ